MGYIRAIREALIEYVQEDADVAEWMEDRNGKWYVFAEGSKLPLELTKSDCPCIIVTPGRAPRRPATNVHVDVEIAIDWRIVVEETNAGIIEDIYCLVEAAIDKGAPGYGLEGTASPHLCELSGTDFEFLVERDDDGRALGRMWALEFSTLHTIRRAA